MDCRTIVAVLAALLLAGCSRDLDRHNAKATNESGDRIDGNLIFVSCTAGSPMRDPIVRRAPYFVVIDCGHIAGDGGAP